MTVFLRILPVSISAAIPTGSRPKSSIQFFREPRKHRVLASGDGKLAMHSYATMNVTFNEFVQELVTSGAVDQAEKFIRGAIQHQPNKAELHALLAEIMLTDQRPEAALQVCEAMLAKQPDDVGCHYQAAHANSMLKRVQPAIRHFLIAFKQRPLLQNCAAWAEYIGRETGDWHTVLQLYDWLLKQQPDNASVWESQAYAAAEAQDYDLLLRSFQRAYVLCNEDERFLSKIGGAYLLQERYEEAEPWLMHARKADPDSLDVANNLGMLALHKRRLDEADAAFQAILERDPAYLHGRLNQARCAAERGDHAQAEEYYRKLIAEYPQNHNIRFHFAAVSLSRGEWAAGFTHFESRFVTEAYLGRQLRGRSGTRWTGQALPGKQLFVWAEQGYGDCLQFVRFLPALAERVAAEGGRVVFCCFEPQYTLFRASLPESIEMVTPSTLDEMTCAPEYHCPLLSVPLCLQVDTVAPPKVGAAYLQPRSAARAHGKKLLAQQGQRGLKVGLAWHGSAQHKRERFRQVPFELLEPLLKIPGITFYSLLPGESELVSAASARGCRLVDAMHEVSDFETTAGLVSQLDLVLTSCTATVHLAGALGVPTWLMLDVAHHWAWPATGAATPWYDSVRLYRQPRPDDWVPVIETVETDLRMLAGQIEQDELAAL